LGGCVWWGAWIDCVDVRQERIITKREELGRALIDLG